MRGLFRFLLEWLSRWLRSRPPPTLPRRRDAPPEGGYAPRADGQPDPGEVVWAWVAFEEDPSRGKDRPVLIVGRRGTRLTGLALTSRANDRDRLQLELGPGPWDRQGRSSYVKLDRVLDVDPRAVRREGAALDRARFDRVVSALERARRAR